MALQNVAWALTGRGLMDCLQYYDNCLFLLMSLSGFFLIYSANIQNFRERLSNCDVKKEKSVYNEQKLQKQDLFPSCGMEIIIFHSWLPPLMKY
jgi:hypothetical protein